MGCRLQILHLGRHDAFQALGHPRLAAQAAEHHVAIQRVAQRIGMEAGSQEQAIRQRGPQDHAHRILREARQRAVRRQQLIPMVLQQLVERGEARDDLVHIVQDGELHAVQRWLVVTPRARALFLDEAHRIRAGCIEIHNREGQGLPGNGTEAAEIDAIALSAAEQPLRQHADAQHGFPVHAVRVLVALAEARLKQRFQIDQHRMLARCNQVFVVEVRGFDRVQQRKVLTLARVEAPHLVARHAAQWSNELQPTVVAAIQDVEDAQRRLCAAFVQPPQELLKVRAHGQRPGLVDDADAGAERHDDDRAPLPMLVALAVVERLERAQILPRAEPAAQLSPVHGQALQELETEGHPVIQTEHHLAREHRILTQEPQRHVRLPQPRGKTGEARLGRVSPQQALDAGDIQLQQHRRDQHLQQLVLHVPEQLIFDALVPDERSVMLLALQ